MTVRLEQDVAVLEGTCPVEDAEALFCLLDANPDRTVDLTRCSSLHGAVVQLILAFGSTVRGEPPDEFLRDWILPSLGGRAERAEITAPRTGAASASH